MNNLKVVWSSDFHLGLKTDEIDRTPEIYSIFVQIIKHCAALKKKGDKVILVLGGDIFNNNNPSEYLISVLIKVLNGIKKYDIKTYFLVGNHDYISDPERLSCLSFLKEAKVGYPSITLVDDIKFMKVGVFDNGPLYFTFLPHIGKATVNDKAETVEDYINEKCNAIVKKVDRGSNHLVFSHLSIRGTFGGSEENLLRKSESYLPDCFINTPIGYDAPTIVQGHYHSAFVAGNINVIGSPIYCSFGEKEEDKYFIEIDVSKKIGLEDSITYIKTKHKKFKQIDVDIFSEDVSKDFFEIDEVSEFLNDIDKDNDYYKINVTLAPEFNNFDWEKINKELSGKSKFFKPILPRIVHKRPVRSEHQKIGLDHKQAIKVYLNNNIRKDKSKKLRLYKKAVKYLGE